VEKRETSICNEYRRKIRKLDRDLGSVDDTHPFTNAIQNSFHSRGIHPLVFGHFGETNAKCYEFVKWLTKKASLQRENAFISPINEEDGEKGRIYQVLL